VKKKLSRVPIDLAEINKTEAEQAGLKPDVPQQQRHAHASRGRGPPQRGYTDRRGAAMFLGIGLWFFDQLVRECVLPRGFPLTPGGKHFWSYQALDEAMTKAARSRKPRRKAQGIVRQRLEARDDR
jgi:hypothetical protein